MYYICVFPTTTTTRYDLFSKNEWQNMCTSTCKVFVNVQTRVCLSAHTCVSVYMTVCMCLCVCVCM